MLCQKKNFKDQKMIFFISHGFAITISFSSLTKNTLQVKKILIYEVKQKLYNKNWFTCSLSLHSIIENLCGPQKPQILILVQVHGSADTKTTKVLQPRYPQARKIRKLHQHLIFFSSASFTLFPIYSNNFYLLCTAIVKCVVQPQIC